MPRMGQGKNNALGVPIAYTKCKKVMFGEACFKFLTVDCTVGKETGKEASQCYKIYNSMEKPSVRSKRREKNSRLKILILHMAHGGGNEYNSLVPYRGGAASMLPGEQDLFLTKLMKDGFLITCGIQVTNLTSYSLTNPQTTINRGAIDYPPCPISPKAKGILVGRKTSNSATGTSGVVSWNIEGKKRRLVLMWCVPFDNNIYSNWMAVGLTKETSEHRKQWYDQMYYNDPGDNLSFKRKKFRWDTNEVDISDDNFTVSGTMGTGHKAEVKVIIKEK